MSTFLERQFRATECARDEVVARLDELSAEQREWKAAPEDWSPLQIAEHLVLSYETVGSLQWASSQRNSKRGPRAQPGLLRLVVWAMKRNIRLPLPSPAVEPQGQVSWPQIKARWESANEEMRESLKLPRAARRAHRPFVHPVVGALSTREMLELNQVHNAYHLRQLKTLLRALPSD